MPITTPHTALPDLNAAVYSALTASSAFTNRSTGPFAKAPTSQPFPYTTFGMHQESNWYTFQNTGRQVLFSLNVWSQKSFEEVYAIIDVITQTLETQTLTLTHFTMAQNDFTFDTAEPQEAQDGVTLYVTARYRVHLTAK